MRVAGRDKAYLVSTASRLAFGLTCDPFPQGAGKSPLGFSPKGGDGIRITSHKPYNPLVLASPFFPDGIGKSEAKSKELALGMGEDVRPCAHAGFSHRKGFRDKDNHNFQMYATKAQFI